MAHLPTVSASIVRSDSSEDEYGDMAPANVAETVGVVRHVTETFSVGGYRYTSLTDAIAQARRMAKLEHERG